MRRVLPIRAVEDDHVDRLGVEVQQCTKLTSTNRSIGLIPLIYQCSLYLATASRNKIQLLNLSLSLTGLVVIARRPNPIPSRTRPLSSSAPMVLRLKAWESRSLPGLLKTRMKEKDRPLSRGEMISLSSEKPCKIETLYLAGLFLY